MKNTNTEKKLVESMNKYIKDFNKKDSATRKQLASSALRRTGVTTKSGALKKRIVTL